MLDVRTPITGAEIATIPTASPADVDSVMDRAADAAAEWRRTPATERGRALLRLAELMRSRAEEIAELETLNTGKPLADTRREALRAAECFAYFGGYADKLLGTTIPVAGAYHTYTRREPHGVAVGIIPWNAPYVFAAKKIAPALAFGNASVLKPAEETPLTALRLREIMDDADVPDDLAQIVVGGGDVGAALVDHPRADLVVFTGYHETGRVIAKAAAQRLTPVTLELGGKSPQVVFADADLDDAVEGIVLGIVGACGQMCIAGSRLYLENSIAEEVTRRVAERIAALRVGDPREEMTSVGPQTTARQRDKTLAMIESGVAEGATVLVQAPIPADRHLADGYWVPPTVFVDVDPGMRLMREEIFGPVLAVTTFTDEADAVRQANASPFGLAAGVWTRDVGRAHRIARDLEVGTVWLNTYRVLSDLVPFGGNGLSGHGRENGEEAARLYTRTKSVWTAHEPGLPAGYRL